MDRPVVAIIPAYNEADRVAAVIRPLIHSHRFSAVIVVDDGSTDATAANAKAAGATVLRPPRNLRKGGAMQFGLAALPSTCDVAFFDADLLGLTPGHIEQMLGEFRRSGAGIVAGLRDYGRWNDMQGALEPITGERVVRREVLARMQPGDWQGFEVEARMNEACRRLGLPISHVILPGLRIVPKWHKIGFARGLADAGKMAREVLVAMGRSRSRADSPPPDPLVIDVVIPAHNEAGRVGAVVREVVASGMFRRVICVDDGSADTTGAEASAAGAEVLSLRPNRGKAGAMRAGFLASDARWLMFLDADLRGLRREHLEALRAEVASGQHGMVIGADLSGAEEPHPLAALYLVSGLNLSGQRIVHRSILERLPERLWTGYSIEAGLDVACRRMGFSARRILLNGLSNTFQREKRGMTEGYRRVAAIHREALAGYARALEEQW